MKSLNEASWAALAVALVAIFAVAGCNDYGNTFQNNTGAVLSFLSPSRISAGNGDLRSPSKAPASF